MKSPPGPRAVIPGRILYLMSRDIVGFLTRVQQTYGDVAGFRLANRRVFLLSHPEHIREVLVTRAEQFTKGPALRAAKVTLGEGLLTSEGDFHRRQRRLMQPAFHAQRVADYADTIVRFGVAARGRWQGGQTIGIRAAMTRLTLEIVAKALFDAEIEEEVRELGEAMDVTISMFDRARMPWGRLLGMLPLPSNRRFHRAKDRVFETIDRMIAGRRAEFGRDPKGSATSSKKDFLSLLLGARDAEGDGGGMSDEQLRFEAMTLFTAGHETTANALVWTWLLLAQNPAAEAKLHEELRRELGDRPPTAADVPRLVYARAVLAESMRLYPPAWIIGRQATAAFRAGAFDIPAGGVILMPQYIVHRDERWWPGAGRFLPERWVEERGGEVGSGGGGGQLNSHPTSPPSHPPTSSAPRPRYAYFPSAAGRGSASGRRSRGWRACC